MRATRAVADVRHLPRTVFGNRSLMWWGTMGYIMIEGTTLFICAVTYFYLRRNFTSWPPQHIYRPGLVIPTIQVGVMLLSMVPMRWVDRATRRMDLATVRTGLVICSVLILLMCRAPGVSSSGHSRSAGTPTLTARRHGLSFSPTVRSCCWKQPRRSRLPGSCSGVRWRSGISRE